MNEQNPYRKKELSSSQLETYNRNYYDTLEWRTITYKGIPVYKYPADLITYQQLIYDVMPDVIIETGSCTGGSALFFYDTMVSYGIKNPKVISIEKRININEVSPLEKENITFIEDSSLSMEVLNEIRESIKNKKVLVSLDSDHIEDHVIKELNVYSTFVSLNSYIIVEDTFLGEYAPIGPHTIFYNGDNPKGAVDKFLSYNNKFIIDKKYEKVFSMNPKGYLKRIL